MKKELLIVCVALMTSCGSPQDELANDVIPGVNPIEVIAALKSLGLTDRVSHAGGVTIHELTGHDVGVAISANINLVRSGGRAFCTGFVATVVATADSDVQAGLPFLQYMSSVPYDSALPLLMQKWVADNYDMDGASVSAGEGLFLMRAPTHASRVLTFARKH